MASLDGISKDPKVVQEILKYLGVESNKALDLGPGGAYSPIPNQTQASALLTQSIEDLLVDQTVNEDAFPVLKAMPRKEANGIRHEWTNRNSNGGGVEGGSASDYRGGATIGQGEYKREYLDVKFHSDGYETYQTLSELAASIGDMVGSEESAAVTRILEEQNRQLYTGDSRNCPDVMDGFGAWMDKHGSNWDGQHVLDLAFDNRFSALDSLGYSAPDDLRRASVQAGKIMQLPANGRSKGLDYWQSGVDTATDYSDLIVGTAYQILNSGPQSLVTGAVIEAFANKHSSLKSSSVEMDNWAPSIATMTPAATRAKIHPKAPNVIVSLTATAAVNALSKFTTAPNNWAGNYWYTVVALDAKGREGNTVFTTAAAVAVAAGQSVTLTIGAPALVTFDLVTGYRIFRSKRNGTNVAATHMRMIDIPSQGASTVFVDHNTELPGAQTIYGFTKSKGILGTGEIIYTHETERIYLPRTIGATQAIPVAIFTSGSLLLQMPRQLVRVKNYISKSGGFSPLV